MDYLLSGTQVLGLTPRNGMATQGAGIGTTQNAVETLGLLLLPVLVAMLLVMHWRHLKLRLKETLVATKVEVSIAKTSLAKRGGRLGFLGEIAVLLSIAFFVAEILTNTRFVRDEGFIWLLIGLPVSFLLGRLWWRKYR